MQKPSKPHTIADVLRKDDGDRIWGLNCRVIGGSVSPKRNSRDPEKKQAKITYTLKDATGTIDAELWVTVPNDCGDTAAYVSEHEQRLDPVALRDRIVQVSCQEDEKYAGALRDSYKEKVLIKLGLRGLITDPKVAPYPMPVDIHRQVAPAHSAQERQDAAPPTVAAEAPPTPEEPSEFVPPRGGSALRAAPSKDAIAFLEKVVPELRRIYQDDDWTGMASTLVIAFTQGRILS